MKNRTVTGWLKWGQSFFGAASGFSLMLLACNISNEGGWWFFFALGLVALVLPLIVRWREIQDKYKHLN